MTNSQAARWCFTINNFSDDDVDRLVNFVDNCKYLVFGNEVGENGTPHLQGFFVLNRSQRFNWIRQRIPNAHLEQARGTNLQAAEYCKKDGDFQEFGDVPVEQGKRSDWDKYREWILELGRVPSERELIRFSPSLYARYKDACYRIADAFLEPPVFTDAVPREGWQTEVASQFEVEADPREVTFVVDPQGNSGKSWMTRYALTKYPEKVQVFRVGKRDDVAHAIDPTKTIFMFDVPRDQMQFFPYPILEMLKDQLVFSPKYNSGMKRLRHVPCVIVLSNEHPDMNKLTADRYNVIEI